MLTESKTRTNLLLSFNEFKYFFKFVVENFLNYFIDKLNKFIEQT